MVLIQVLLPIIGDTGGPVDSGAFATTRAELVEAFDGVTAYVRSPAEGVWTAPDGRVEHDAMVMVEVVTGAFDRAWWRAYRQTLARRFRQETIHVRAMSVDVLDNEGA